MSVEIWPAIAPHQLADALEASRKRELDWLISELQEPLNNIKSGLEECYALIAPAEPGNTLVLTTPRNEIVKGHITRVGTRIVKGTIHLRLRTLPHQTLTIAPDHPIDLAPLEALHNLLTQALSIITHALSPTTAASPPLLASELRLLSHAITQASAFLLGQPRDVPDPTWTTHSIAPSHFSPPLPVPRANIPAPTLSLHLDLQESCLVLWLRTLEPAGAPVNFGTKIALAIGTARRLEHDEADRVFGYVVASEDTEAGRRRASSATQGAPLAPVLSGTRRKEVDVYVREKVRVETADPSLLALAAKLTALGHTLRLARSNLAAAMGVEEEEDD